MTQIINSHNELDKQKKKRVVTVTVTANKRMTVQWTVNVVQ